MIKSLHISNYALISQIDIDLCTGLNIVTGETGAGKSVMLGALGLLLGGRADMRVVRDSERKSVIEAVATIGDVPGIDAVFEENNLDRVTDGVCILRRELLPGGRSRAFINDTPVTLQVLKAVALRLIDIHSQHQNLLLADTDYQLSIIDSLADNADERALYSVAYAALALQIHVVEHLRLHILGSHRIGIFKQTVGQGRLTMVDVSYNTKVADIFHSKRYLVQNYEKNRVYLRCHGYYRI